MLRKCLALTLVGLAVAAASIHPSTKTGDMDMLLKQKKVLNLLMYVENKILTDTECFEVGRNYDIMANIDHYTNREVVVDFLMRYRVGILSRDALFTPHLQEHRQEMILLYHLLYVAKDFNTFYKTACWARLHVNSGMFTTAFTTAVIYRDDCKFIRVPAINEIYPNLFFDSKVIREAQRIAMTRGMTNVGRNMGIKSDSLDTVETYHLRSNYTDLCLSPMFNLENKLNYFTEDVGLNAYYYYVRMMLPFWVNTKNHNNLPRNIRGDLYYFVHQQLMARYNLERVSNGLGEIEDFTWNRMSLPGFYANIIHVNGVAMPQRDWWNVIPIYKQKYLEYLKKIEIRILEAIDSGYVIDEMGKQISLRTTEGLNILGNIIEGNHDSINLKYYGSLDVLARTTLGQNLDCKNKDCYVPSSLQLFSSSLKDPAFYRIYDKIVQYFLRHKTLLNKYTKTELEFNGVRIENVETDRLVTYFDEKDFLINNAIDVPTMKDGVAFNIKTWKYQLNNKPFTYKLNINSDKTTKAVVRIFLGPAVEDEKYDDYSYLVNYYKYFFMLDEFAVDLREGTNSINRLSTESVLFKKEHLTGDKFHKKILQAIHGKEPITFDDRMWGFPSNLLLPKGSADGMRFKLLVHIGPYEDAKIIDLPILGKRMCYGKPLGFPLDRPMKPWFIKLDNIYLKDVLIHHIGDYEVIGSSHRQSINVNYDDLMGIRDSDLMQLKDLKNREIMNENVGDFHDNDRESMGTMRDINMLNI